MVQLVKTGLLSQTKAGHRYQVHRNTVKKWLTDAHESGNWLCLDKKSTPEKYRLSSGLKYIHQVSVKISRKIERQRMLYNREHLGELVHFDTKKLPKLEGETIKDGKEYVFVAIDDCSRWVYAAVMPDKTDDSAASFLDEVLTVTPVPIQAVMTDNGKEYRGKLERGHAFETLLDQEKITHIYTKVKTPKTNGKAERMIRTIMMWHRQIQFESREQRSYLLTDFISWYNTKKGHSSLKGETPYEFIVNHYKLCQECTQRLGS
jgi:transposase InsO family protein